MLEQFASLFRRDDPGHSAFRNALSPHLPLAPAPYTSPRDYGKIQLKFKNTNNNTPQKQDSLTIKDLYSHTIVLGESGSGKTFYILNQLLEELFRSTHLRPSTERENKKLGGLIIEAKGDFTPKTRYLAHKYDRASDIIFFGPDHLENSYDMFGDPTESPPQLADKMIQLLTAFGGGKKSNDPFWDNAARKLFTHLFLLYRGVEASKSTSLPPLSFELLNLLILDRGQPHNLAEIETDRITWEKTYANFVEELSCIRSFALHVKIETESIFSLLLELTQTIEAENQAWARLLEQSIPPTDPHFASWQGELSHCQTKLKRGRDQVNALTTFLSCGTTNEATNALGDRLDRLRSQVQGLLGSQDESERGDFYHELLEEATFLIEFALLHLGDLAHLMRSTEEDSDLINRTQKQLTLLVDHLTQCTDLGERILGWTPPEAQVGVLRQLLQSYHSILIKEEREVRHDAIYAYFQEEYLNVINDKTSGSVGMVASNLVTLFVHPPFNQIFSAQKNFSMAQVVDEGKIVVLDMPIALYGAISTVAALVLKIDFFRTMLSRHRLKVDFLSDELPPQRKHRFINQDRPMVYFCDEFASVASTGETTGESGFLDKVREYKCGCILGLQSIPMLLKRFSQAEVDAILTNCANKIFLRNSDPRTNELASKLLGTEYKVNLNRVHTAMEMALNGDMPIGKEGYSASYSIGSRVDPGDFSQLEDGVAYLKLNPRLGKRQIGKVAFTGHPIPSLLPE